MPNQRVSLDIIKVQGLGYDAQHCDMRKATDLGVAAVPFMGQEILGKSLNLWFLFCKMEFILKTE